MKKLVPAIIAIAAITCYSCEPIATFNKPQPADVLPLASFPERIQGKYLATDEVTILTITDKLITLNSDYDYKVHKDSLGPYHKISGDTLINLTEGTKEKLSLTGDTVTIHSYSNDTIFSITNGSVLKKFKGYYFLSNRYDDNIWEVKQLSLKKGMLIMGSISGINDIQKLNEITETTADTLPTHYNLTKRQFKHAVRADVFSTQETFTRMNAKTDALQ
jgi:hypothetical protein